MATNKVIVKSTKYLHVKKTNKDEKWPYLGNFCTKARLAPGPPDAIAETISWTDPLFKLV